ncbi:uncharacterized protein E0L32_006076 [Thyridium curvatum]|uniref:Uncharacterized protein n=1 Tax=Thyridium curvatum TaxID=1093900 RepID=A0A507AS31_9PEZI|nr:uncharacterized protein E0L32_006076 [Thyridium curvatum]TPX13605.1 hypothetical protein E0L32_006076 [Thyridium curvatum]
MTTYTQWNHDTTAEEVIRALADKVKGRTFLITGTSARGLGANTATALARASPAHLILVSRNKSKVDPVIDEIRKIDSSVKVTFVACDLSDLDSVRHAADEINGNSEISKIDAVINNAGIMAIQEYTLDKRGVEMTLSACHVGHFLLTNLIMPKIKAAGPGARVVNLTSLGHQIGPFRFGDHNFSGGKAYDPWSAYGQAKTANVLFTKGLAGRGVLSYAVHPGSIYETALADHLEMKAFDDIAEVARANGNPDWSIHPPKTTSQGVSTTLAAALRPDIEGDSGAYMSDCQPEATFEWATKEEYVEKLWTVSEELVGQKFDL